MKVMRAVAIVALHGAAACAQTPRPASPPGTAPPAPATATADTNAAGLVPAGFGTLRQERIAIELRLPNVIVRLTPLDESVIRTLSPDSYRALRENAESRRPLLTRLATQHGLQRGNVWYVMFYGLAPDARFSPQELTVTSLGREYRPVEVIPISTGFGKQRLQPRETQTALYLFEDALDANQPLTVSFGGVTNTAWAEILRAIERERALIRSRAQGR